MYVCRASHPEEGQLIPGKLYKPTDCCYISLNGKEHCVQNYFVMIKGVAGVSQGFAHKTSTTIFFSEGK